MRPKMKVRMRRCGDCGGVHADFWRSTPPPSCAERRSRLPCGECGRVESHKLDCSRRWGEVPWLTT